MAANDVAITTACFLKLEAPGGDVRLCDGGFLYFAADGVSERYDSEHPVFGTIYKPEAVEEGVGSLAPGSSIAFAPAPDASQADWYRDDLADCRLRIWFGEIGADGKTVSSAELTDDMLVDTIGTSVGARGQWLLELELIARSEKFFLRNEGNVCSTRHHQSVFAGELGFDNCSDLPGYFAWGTEAPPRGTGGGSGGGGGFGGGGSGPTRTYLR